MLAVGFADIARSSNQQFFDGLQHAQTSGEVITRAVHQHLQQFIQYQHLPGTSHRDIQQLGFIGTFAVGHQRICDIGKIMIQHHASSPLCFDAPSKRLPEPGVHQSLHACSAQLLRREVLLKQPKPLVHLNIPGCSASPTQILKVAFSRQPRRLHPLRHVSRKAVEVFRLLGLVAGDTADPIHRLAGQTGIQRSADDSGHRSAQYGNRLSLHVIRYALYNPVVSPPRPQIAFRLVGQAAYWPPGPRPDQSGSCESGKVDPHRPAAGHRGHFPRHGIGKFVDAGRRPTPHHSTAPAPVTASPDSRLAPHQKDSLPAPGKVGLRELIQLEVNVMGDRKMPSWRADSRQSSCAAARILSCDKPLRASSSGKCCRPNSPSRCRGRR